MRRGAFLLIASAIFLSQADGLDAQPPVAFPPVPIDVGGPVDPETGTHRCNAGTKRLPVRLRRLVV